MERRPMTGNGSADVPLLRDLSLGARAVEAWLAPLPVMARARAKGDRPNIIVRHCQTKCTSPPGMKAASAPSMPR